MLAPRRIAEVTMGLGAIPHVASLRWHTRVPVVDPERITDELVAALRHADRAVWIGIHTNHARELTPAARSAIRRLAAAGLALVGQTVLLKGVNCSGRLRQGAARPRSREQRWHRPCPDTRRRATKSPRRVILTSQTFDAGFLELQARIRLIVCWATPLNPRAGL